MSSIPSVERGAAKMLHDELPNRAHRLSQLQRDLHFFDVPPRDGRRLNRRQIDDFNAHGYLSPLQLGEPGRIQGVRRRATEVMEASGASSDKSFFQKDPHLGDPAVREILRDKALMDSMEDLLGPDVILWSSSLLIKRTTDTFLVSWHQDAPFWPLTPSKTITAWVALDCSTTDNGCMKVIPGSHRLGVLEHQIVPDGTRDLLWMHATAVPSTAPADLVLRAGEYSLHSDLTLHASGPNHSGNDRGGLALRFCSADVVAYWEFNRNAIVCRGTDRFGHWTTPGNT